jgi:geranylgeranyl diphosphate synthase type I
MPLQTNSTEGDSPQTGNPWADFIQSFEPAYEALVDDFIALLDYPGFREQLNPVFREYLLRKGKWLRPLLFFAGHQIFSESATSFPHALMRPAAGLELFHNFVLIHDDVIDGAETRRGKPSLQSAIAATVGCSARHADHLAVVFGDILFSYSVEQFAGPFEAVDLLRPFLQLARETGAGEGIELISASRDIHAVTEEEILKTYDLKTTRYTFGGPLHLGGIAAGYDPGALAPLQAVSHPLGLAFQIENDLHEIRHPDNHNGGFAVDFKAGIKTLVIKRFYQQCDSAGKERLLQLFQDPDPDHLAIESLHQSIRNSDAFKALENQTDALFARAEAAVKASGFSQSIRDALLSLCLHLKDLSYHSQARPPAETS